MANRHYIMTVNSRDAYLLREQLTKHVVNRMKKGLSVSVEVLRNCSTMRKLTAIGSKLCREWNDSFTKEDVRETASNIADLIIQDAEYILALE